MSAQTASQDRRCQLAIGFTDTPFSMNPARFNRIQPGTLDGQEVGEQARFACRLRRPVVGAYPAAYVRAFVPGSIVPDDDHNPFAFRPCHCQQADDEQPHLQAVGLSSAEIQQHCRVVMPYRAKTCQGFIDLTALGFALYQAQCLTRFGPGMSLWLGETRKPAFIFLHQQPIRVLLGLLFQPVAPLFLTV